MPPTAKICGLATREAVAAAIAGGASHVGFVFFAASPRNVAPAHAAALPTPPHVARVGVFVDPDDALLEHAVAVGRLDAIQLHGAEPPSRAAAVARRFGREVWKAIPVRGRADLAAADTYAGAAARILYDAKPPAGAALPGGSGLRFDWTLLAGHAQRLPWALSGGLDAANVADAVGVTRARLVDISSGVESAPGVKDVDKIGAFLQALGRIG